MRHSAFVWALILIVGGGLAISIVLFPFYQQVSLMLADEGEYREALARYQAESAHGEDTLPVLVSTVKMLQEIAKEQQGIVLAENFVANHPDNAEAVAFLLKLYEDSNRDYEYLHLFLTRGPRPAPEPLLRGVQKVCESLGNVKAEVPILEDLVFHYDGTAKEHYRLAYFLSVANKNEEAVDVVKRMIKKFPVDTLSNFKIDLALRILVRQGMMDDALNLAKAVISSSNHRSEYFDVVSIFVEEDRPREGLAVLDMLPEKLRDSDMGYEVRFSLLDSLGETKDFYSTLNKLIDSRQLSSRLFSDALPPALDEGSTQLLLKMIDIVDLQKVPQSNLADLATRAVDRDEPTLAQGVYDKLGEPALQAHPALLLALALGMGDVSQEEASRRYDTVASRLSDREKAFLAPLFEIRGMDKLAHRVLAGVTSMQGFSPQEAFSLALKFVSFGMVNQGKALLDDYTKNLPVPPVELQAATVLLDIAKGNVPQVLDWIKKQHDIPEAVLKGFFAVAYDKKHAEIAQVSAEQLTKRWPSNQYVAYLAAAWAIGDREQEGLALLSQLFSEGQPVATLYVDALAYREHAEPSLQKELSRVVDEEVHNPTVSPAQLRRLGYLLINAHLDKIASPLFERLAAHSSFANDDMQALLYVWGTHPTASQNEWLVQRAIAAPSRDEVHWLTYFSQRDEPKIVLDIIKASPGGDQGDQAITDIHFQALVSLKHTEEASQLLTAILEDKPDIKRLKELVIVARGGDFIKGVETLYEHILDDDPNDIEALKALGLLNYDRGDVISAKEYLERYLDLADGDYLVNYYYGQVLDYHKCLCVARDYYELALQQLEAIEEPTFDEKLVLTHVLVRMQCYDIAVGWFWELIREKPLQIGLYNDLAELFLDRECFCDANEVIMLGYEAADDPEAPEGQEESFIFLQLQQVRLFRELNYIVQAMSLNNELMCEYPNNSEVYAVAADLELVAGNWIEAIDLVDTALDIACERNVLWDQLDAILIDHQPYWSLGAEYRTCVNQHETLLRYHYENDLFFGYRFFADFEMDHGVIGDFLPISTGLPYKLRATRERGAFGVIEYLPCGATVQGSLLVARDVAGVGIRGYQPDPYGSWTAEAVYHEPCWDLVQSTFQNGARNRVQATRVIRPFPRNEAFGTLGYNHYFLETNQSMATSYLLQGGWAYRLSKVDPLVEWLGEKGDIVFVYGLDKEHVLSQVTRIAVDGIPFQPLALASREIHTGSVGVTKYFRDWLAVDGSAGYSYDRVARLGTPEGTFGVTVGRKCEWQWRLLYRHSLSTTGLNSAEDAISIDLRAPL